MLRSNSIKIDTSFWIVQGNTQNWVSHILHTGVIYLMPLTYTLFPKMVCDFIKDLTVHAKDHSLMCIHNIDIRCAHLHKPSIHVNYTHPELMTTGYLLLLVSRETTLYRIRTYAAPYGCLRIAFKEPLSPSASVSSVRAVMAAANELTRLHQGSLGWQGPLGTVNQEYEWEEKKWFPSQQQGSLSNTQATW